ncbi:hypothetical protein BASA81_001910 [Batrachochytrium salamandrivorans]|nr:hypothetical protein BASA81_001910 [Batrachochytrium salamandrivorans]
MEFFNKVGSAAESLLEQVDKRGAELSQDVRSGNRATRQYAAQIEKKLQQHQNEPNSNSEALLELQRDLAACHEVLANSQLLAADREAKLCLQMENLRQEREARETELLGRIRSLENEKAAEVDKECGMQELIIELEQLREAKNGDELQLQAENARREAEHFAKALQVSEKEFSQRSVRLEQANLELLAQISALQRRSPATVGGANSLTNEQEEQEEEEAEAFKRMTQRRLVQLEDDKANLEHLLIQTQNDNQRLQVHTANAQELTTQLEVYQARVGELQQQLHLAKQFVENTDKTKQLESRLEALSKHVEIKQRQIDILRSEKAGLVNQLSLATAFQQQQQGAGRSKPPPRLKIRHKELSRVVDAVDGLTLSLGQIMRASPLLRLAFLAYLLLLHFWVFHIINWSSATTTLNEAAPIAEPHLRTN